MKFYKFQRGNATLLTLFVFAVAGLAVFGLFNVGQQTTGKVRLQTVSDAAAYSVGTVVARDLNFKAYTNRAMVANQIAIAQIVGLASWAQMFNRAATNLSYVATALSWIPVAGQIILTISRALERGSAIVNNAIDRAAPALVMAEEVLITALAEAQRAFHVVTVAMAKDTLSTVVEQSDSDIDTGALWSNAIFWGAFVRTWEGRQERYEAQRVGDNSRTGIDNRERTAEFRDVTKASGDRFVNGRTYSWLPAITIPFLLKIRMEKYGGSEMMPGRTPSNRNNYQWTAMDSVGIEIGTWRCGFSGCGFRSYDEVLPIGWGAAHALVTNSSYFNYQQYRRDRNLWGQGTWRLPITSSLGAAEEGNNNLRKTDGLRPFYDLKDKGRVADDYLNLQVLLFKRGDKMRTMATVAANNPNYVVAPGLNVEEKGGMAGNTMGALAKAGVYFYRPNEGDFIRPDRKREYGNLYNPYWQVRLMPTSNAERTAALAVAQF
ncbi:Tad domain-containing protein [Tahibacter soli]|uniref:Tad domain-containing protein n=1 Tax=Tahibacter soli TaxID=2983605 RepID=A0A9X4BKA8_9GAMM|nr:Tad domain-containing protein [Tahibacter soli]MDC8015956.1 Tad domain-containing protein [Tahibacter soli]